MPPPSSGGIALLQMLGMLEARDVGALRNDPAARAHLFAEVMTRAFRDRAEYLGDPAFVQVPVAQLLDPAYIRARMNSFSPNRATPSASVEPGLGRLPVSPPRESLQTTHFSVVDAAGGAVSNTYTLNGAFGCGATVPGTGILLNNEMDDFMSAPGVPNLFGLIQGESNAITPGKRPLSSMTPTLLLRSGKLFLVTGSPGGPTIINTVLQVVTNTIDLGMPPCAAVAAPRIHHQWMPDRLDYEPGALTPAALAQLRAEGHILAVSADSIGDSETIEVDPATGVRLGASDPRNGDSAAVAQTPVSH